MIDLPQPEPERQARMLIVLDDVRPMTCDECGALIETGQRAEVFSAPPIIVHASDDGGCPPRWTPHVLAGGRLERVEQLTLPLLTSIRDESGPT